MKITIVVDNPQSWFMPDARVLLEKLQAYGNVVLIADAGGIEPGNDLAFLLSCEKIVSRKILARSRANIVVHASELPRGRGMSPLTWQILEGADKIPVTLLEAVEQVDAGPVYLRSSVTFRGNELLGEMQESLGEKIVEMCVSFVAGWPGILGKGVPQNGEPTFYKKRTPEDSRLDPDKTISEQFNLLRVADNDRYPAFFDLRGRRYFIKLTAGE
jgi:methionyl-tRNA formyltransferase